MKTTDTSDPITLSDHLLSSLLGEIPTILHFKGKWFLITSKLRLLHSRLGDFSSHFPHSSFSNSLSRDLILSIAHTLDDAVSILKDCQFPTLCHGKLKTQSLIDSLLATLDRHLSDCNVLFKSGVLRDDAVSNASHGDAVRSESRNLIARLQIGSSDSRTLAMDSFLGLLQEDDKNVMIALPQGVVSVLVRLLDSSSSEMKEKIVAAISRISTVDSSRHALIAEGLVLLNHLLRVLDHGSGFAKEKACIALQALTFSKENARAIGSGGGISSLLDICQPGTPGSQAYAAGVLRNLAVFPEVRENFVEENAIVVLLGLVSILLSLVHSKTCRKKIAAAGASAHTRKLVEMNVEGSKKILDSLGRAKIWEAFARSLG